MPINLFNKPECEDCNELDDYWRTADELVVAKLKAWEMECRMAMGDPISENSRIQKGGRLSGLRDAINLLEVILK